MIGEPDRSAGEFGAIRFALSPHCGWVGLRAERGSGGWRARGSVLVRQLQLVLVIEDIVLPPLDKISGAVLRRFLRCHIQVLAVVGPGEEDDQDAGEEQRSVPVPMGVRVQSN